MSILRGGTLASPGTYNTTPALFIKDIAGDGPATQDTLGLFRIEASRIGDTDPNAVNATLMSVSNDTGSAFFINGKRQVGIGTIAPAKKLDVSSSDENLLRLQRTDASARQWDINIRPSFVIGDNTAAADRLTIDTSGKVGIGVSTPNERLQVAGAISATGNATTSFASSSTMDFNSGYTRFISRGANTTSPGGFRFLLESSNSSIVNTAMMIVDNGNVLINTTTDSGYRLDVNGTAAFGLVGDVIFTKSNGTSYSRFLYSGANANVVFSGGTTANNGAFGINNYENSIRLVNILNNGNVGIGTTTPQGKLDITGGTGDLLYLDGGVNTDFAYKIVSGADDAFVLRRQHTTQAGLDIMSWTYSGKVGIGTTSPTGLLHLYGADPAFRIQSSTTGNMQFGQWDGTNNRIQSSGRDFLLTQTDSYNMLFHTNSTERMRITSGGNVLIGTTTDSGYKLDVNGSGRISGNVVLSGTNVFGSSAATSGFRNTIVAAAANNTTVIPNWPYFVIDSQTMTRKIVSLTDGGNGGTSTAGTGTTCFIEIGEYYSGRGVIQMAASGGSSPSDQGTGRGKDLLILSGNSDNGAGYVGGRLFLQGGSGYSGGYNTNFGSVLLQSQGGNVGVGLLSPSSKFNVEVGSNTDGIFLSRSGTNKQAILILADTANGASISGGTNPDGTATQSDGFGRLILQNGSSEGFIFQTSAVAAGNAQSWNTRMSIKNNGNVLINTTGDAGYRLDVNGDSRSNRIYINNSANCIFTQSNGSSFSRFLYSGSHSNVVFSGGTTANNGCFGVNNFEDSVRIFNILNSGAATFTSSVTASSFFESSDKTIKTLIQDNYQTKGIESVTAKLYIKNGKEELGYYAQDLQDILPSAVSTGDNGLLNLSYREVHTAKISSLEHIVKEQQAQIQELKELVNQLSNK